MKSNLFLSAVLLLATCPGAGLLQASELIEEFTGERTMQTGEFEVEGPWILDWRVSGDYARDMAVDVSLVEAGTQTHQGNVLKTKTAGNGVRLFQEGGRFFFRVHSTLATWTLKVEQLTPEEAELYTPKSETRLDY
jgi:hypothetical protein